MRINRGVMILLLLIFFNCLWLNVANRKEIEKVKIDYVNRYRKAPDLWSHVVGLWYEDPDIFSVPVDNAVGTCEWFNGITLLRFVGDGIDYDLVRKDFVTIVGGAEYHVPLFSDSWIGYTQGRGFLLFNVKTGAFVDHTITHNMDVWLGEVRHTGRGKFEFVFNVKMDIKRQLLKVIDFDGKGGFKILSELEIGEFENIWTVNRGIVFVYNIDSIEMKSYDINLKEIKHPFCDIIRNLKEQKVIRFLSNFVIHPTLPIAILVDIDMEKSGLTKIYLVNWEESDEKKRVVELPKEMLSIVVDIERFSVDNFDFSPDGRWLVFQDWTDNISNFSPIFMAIPVDSKRDFPLGKAKVLGTMLKERASVSSTAWIKKPLSYVVCDGTMLYKWELDKLKREFYDR